MQEQGNEQEKEREGGVKGAEEMVLLLNLLQQTIGCQNMNDPEAYMYI